MLCSELVEYFQIICSMHGVTLSQPSLPHIPPLGNPWKVLVSLKRQNQVTNCLCKGLQQSFMHTPSFYGYSLLHVLKNDKYPEPYSYYYRELFTRKKITWNLAGIAPRISFFLRTTCVFNGKSGNLHHITIC